MLLAEEVLVITILLALLEVLGTQVAEMAETLKTATAEAAVEMSDQMVVITTEAEAVQVSV